jgi:hypothetical protein
MRDNSLYSLQIDIDEQYIPMINDVIRITVIQVIAQFLFSLVRQEASFKFMSDIFVQTILFLLVGVLFYWLIVTKIITIKSKTQEN